MEKKDLDFQNIRLLMGDGSWKTYKTDEVRAVVMADGPHGLRFQSKEGLHSAADINKSDEATCFPPAVMAAATFNRELVWKMGEAIGIEASKKGVDLILGPALNIKRTPLCGRGFEYPSEDPYLSGEYGKNFVKGLQSTGVGATVKHFACNNHENYRMVTDVCVDKRALNEVYLYPFDETVTEAEPYCVMAAYNKVNGEWVAHSKELLTDKLRGEWGFKGVVMSDWSGIHNRTASMLAGCDLEMPYSGDKRTEEIREAVETKLLPKELVNASVDRIKELSRKVNSSSVGGKITNADVVDTNVDAVDTKCNSVGKNNDSKSLNSSFDSYNEAHHRLAKRISDEGIVLLKNEDNILPFEKGKVAVIGELARNIRCQGGGSSHVNAYKVSDVLSELVRCGIAVKYAKGYELSGRRNAKLIKKAQRLAKECKRVLLFVGLTDFDEFEGVDRRHARLCDAQLELIKAISEVTKEVIVVLSGGSAVEMTWEKDVKAILYTSVCGQAGAESIADILTGRVNPSGKLTETVALEGYNHFAENGITGGNNAVYYKESIYVGYRYYDKKRIPVMFPFGYGLSYTTFRLEGMKLRNTGDGILEVSVSVTNIGDRAGAEVIQIYVEPVDSSYFSVKELKGFEKVFLNAGETKNVKILLGEKAFRHYDVDNGWCVEDGEYRVFVGVHCCDERISEVITVEGVEKRRKEHFPLDNVTDELFSVLVGKDLPPLNVNRIKNITDCSCGEDINSVKRGKAFIAMSKAVIRVQNIGRKNKAAALNLARVIRTTPLRSMAIMSGGVFDYSSTEILAAYFNGKIGLIKAMSLIIKEKKAYESGSSDKV